MHGDFYRTASCMPICLCLYRPVFKHYRAFRGISPKFPQRYPVYWCPSCVRSIPVPFLAVVPDNLKCATGCEPHGCHKTGREPTSALTSVSLPSANGANRICFSEASAFATWTIGIKPPHSAYKGGTRTKKSTARTCRLCTRLCTRDSCRATNWKVHALCIYKIPFEVWKQSGRLGSFDPPGSVAQDFEKSARVVVFLHL